MGARSGLEVSAGMDGPRVLSESAEPSARAGHGPLPPAPWGVVEIFAAVLLTVVTLVLIAGARVVVLATLGIPLDSAEENPTAVRIAVLGQILLDLAAVTAAAALSIGRYRLNLRAWGLRRQRPVAFGACAGVLAVSFLALGLYRAVVIALGLEDLQPEQNIPPALFDHRSVVPFTVLLVVIVAPFAEELFFRGFVFNGLRRRFGVPGAAVLSGLLFSAIHVTSGDLIGLLVPFAIIGFLFAILVARTGSLWNSILVHLTFNLIGISARIASGTV